MNSKSLLAPTAEDEASTAYPSVREINGIGPTAERRLHKKGIRTVDKLAGLSLSELAKLSGRPAKKIKEQDWLGQARQLVQRASPQDDDATDTNNGQHLVSFVLTLLLNEDNSVRRTTIVNNKNKTTIPWEGWDEEKLLAVITDMAGVQRPSVNTGLSDKPESRPVAPTKAPPTVKGKVQLRQLNALLADTDNPRHLVPHDQPFQVCLTIDLVDIDAPDDSKLDYTATIYAKKLGTGERRFVTKQQNTVPLRSSFSIPIDGVSMPPGTYRLQTLVNLNLPQTARDFTTSMEGGILQVY